MGTTYQDLAHYNQVMRNFREAGEVPVRTGATSKVSELRKLWH